MKPFIKYPGGKNKELPIIIENLPNIINDFYEPFVGGGAVYLDIENCNNFFINDKSIELINLYKNIANQDKEFLSKIKEINDKWNFIGEIVNNNIDILIEYYFEFKKKGSDECINNIDNFIKEYDFKHIILENKNISENIILLQFRNDIINKFGKIKNIEEKKGDLSLNDLEINIETAFKNGFYMYIRYLYNYQKEFDINTHFGSALFYFIRDYCYSSMYRYNSSGKFNVPYGGLSYNKKNLETKIEYIKDKNLVDRLCNTVINSDDFISFFNKYKPKKNDFIFLDPPYDTVFSNYGNNSFTHNDHIRLSNFCKETEANFMLIIKYTDFIYDLYRNFNVKSFNKNYLVSFKNRNDKKVEHLLITNYNG